MDSEDKFFAIVIVAFITMGMVAIGFTSWASVETAKYAQEIKACK